MRHLQATGKNDTKWRNDLIELKIRHNTKCKSDMCSVLFPNLFCYPILQCSKDFTPYIVASGELHVLSYLQQAK